MIDEKQTQYEYKCQKKNKGLHIGNIVGRTGTSTAKQPPGQNVAELSLQCLSSDDILLIHLSEVGSSYFYPAV